MNFSLRFMRMIFTLEINGLNIVKESNKTFSISNYAKEYVRNKYKIERNRKISCLKIRDLSFT